MCKKVIVIGSGLGGLSTGLILSMNGYDVTILEQDRNIGGCLQCFTRKGASFETGMHFIGSAGKGQTLNKLLRYLQIDDKIKLSQLDKNGYDVVSLKGKRYKFANGKEAFINQMTEYFPTQRENLVKYFNLVEKVAYASSLHSLQKGKSDIAISAEYQLKTINEVIESTITEPELAKVLVGNLPLYAAERNKTPFSIHAFIMDFYNQSAYRIVGGSDKIATAMVDRIKNLGGTIKTHSKVTRIICNETQATGVEINGNEILPADYIVSSAHPIRTLELVDSKLIRPAFRKRIKEMPQTIGGFSVYFRFKPNSLPYMNYNFYGYQSDTPWDCEKYTKDNWPLGYLYMHFCPEDNNKYATSGVVLSYMKMEEMEPWIGTKIGHRGEAYELLKKQRAERLIDELEKEFPDIREHIAEYYTSTPLTYFDYTGTESGSLYGIAKDVNLGVACRVPQRTKVPNLFLTGQNINSHGMLGVLVGSIVTCSEFLTPEKIYDDIQKANM